MCLGWASSFSPVKTVPLWINKESVTGAGGVISASQVGARTTGLQNHSLSPTQCPFKYLSRVEHVETGAPPSQVSALTLGSKSQVNTSTTSSGCCVRDKADPLTHSFKKQLRHLSCLPCHSCTSRDRRLLSAFDLGTYLRQRCGE